MNLYRKENPLIKLLGILFFDFFAFAAIIPLIPLLILQPENTLLPPSTSLQVRCILLGALYSSYPFAQMLFSPFLGFLSDKYGRKPMLLIAYLGNAVGYFLFTFGIYSQNIIFLFIGYFVAGATGCNISTTNTVIGDLSLPHEKLQRYSLSNMTIGLSFVLGPLLTGYAVDLVPNIHTLSLLSFTGAGSISLINTLIIYRWFHYQEGRALRGGAPLPPLKMVFYRDKKLLLLLTGAFLLFFGWYAFIKFFQALFLNTPHFKGTEMFTILSYFGVCCAVSQLIFSLFLHKIWNGKSSILWSSFLLAFSILATGFATSSLSLILSVTLFAIAYSILSPCLMFEVSECGDKETSGRVLGIYQSVQDLAKILAPLAAGSAMAFWHHAPTLIACSFILASALAFTLLPSRRATPTTN